MTEAVEIINGTTPTENTSVGDTRVNKNMIIRGTTLAGIASRRQFKSNH